MNYTHKAIYWYWSNPRRVADEARKIVKYGLFEGENCKDVSPMQWRKADLPDKTDESTFETLFDLLYKDLQAHKFRNVCDWNAEKRKSVEPVTWREKYELLKRFA